MHGLSAAEVLDLWDDCARESAPRRGLRLLMAADPGMPADQLAALTVGQRDGRLLALREALWGPEMVALTTCPACREQMEMALDARAFLDRAGPDHPDTLSLQTGGYDLTFRLPTSADLIEATERFDTEDCRDVLLERCLIAVRSEHDADGPVPADVVASVVRAMADADPLSDIQLTMNCPSCHHRWQTGFDIVSFLSTEIDAWAARILRDVHTLASAYGWHERDILNLSAMRRQFYLESVGA